MVHRRVRSLQPYFSPFRLLTQILVVVMLRTQHVPFLQSWPARPLGLALTTMSLIGLALPYIPHISEALQMQHPHPTFYGFLVAILLSYIGLVQGVKVIYMRIYKEWL
jgi:P-type Mg2+ transporter